MITKDKDIKSIVQKAITDYPYDDYWEQEANKKPFIIYLEHFPGKQCKK